MTTLGSNKARGRVLAPAVPIAVLLVLVCLAAFGCGGGTAPVRSGVSGSLPAPDTGGGLPLNEALEKRASVRSFDSRALSREQVSQLLWAAAGVKRGLGETATGATRTPPSAGGVYPLEVYVLEGRSLFRYRPESHSIETVSEQINRQAVIGATGQEFTGQAPSVFVIAGSVAAMEARYAERAERYVYLDAGGTVENLLLEAVSLGLVAVPVGAFDDDALKRALELPAGQSPIYLIPVGYPAG